MDESKQKKQTSDGPEQARNKQVLSAMIGSTSTKNINGVLIEEVKVIYSLITHTHS